MVANVARFNTYKDTTHFLHELKIDHVGIHTGGSGAARTKNRSIPWVTCALRPMSSPHCQRGLDIGVAGSDEGAEALSATLRGIQFRPDEK